MVLVPKTDPNRAFSVIVLINKDLYAAHALRHGTTDTIPIPSAYSKTSIEFGSELSYT
jgi:hypothetical protein